MNSLNKLDTQKLLISLETISSYAFSVGGGTLQSLGQARESLATALTQASETGTFIAPTLPSKLPYQLARFAGLAIANGHTQFAEFIDKTAHYLIPFTE